MKVIMYTMEGCPYCDQLKEKLNESNIDFIEKDIDKNIKEYDKFSEAVKSEFLPAVLIGKKAFIPERSFHTIDQANKVIKSYLLEQDNHGHHLD